MRGSHVNKQSAAHTQMLDEFQVAATNLFWLMSTTERLEFMPMPLAMQVAPASLKEFNEISRYVKRLFLARLLPMAHAPLSPILFLARMKSESDLQVGKNLIGW